MAVSRAQQPRSIALFAAHAASERHGTRFAPVSARSANMPLDQIFRRHFWSLLTVLAGVAAFFGAHGMTQLVGAVIAVDATQLATPPLLESAAASTARAPRSLDSTRILARNPFDSQAGPLNQAELSAIDAEATPPGLSDPMSAPACA